MLKRISLFLLIAAMVAGMFSACGEESKPAETTLAATETTVQTEPAPTVREVVTVGEKMRHMTYNIAGSNTLERIPNFDLNEKKRANMKAMIETIDPDTFGIQEAPQAWIEGMVGLLDNKYTMVGGYSEQVGTNEKFWYNPVYYKNAVFTCVDSGVLFLNEGYHYDKINRNCAFVLLERIADGELVLILSLHLEHRGLGTEELETYNYQNYYEKTSDRNLLRDSQVAIIAQIVAEKREAYGKEKEISVIVSGDFNINAWQDEKYEHEYTRLKDTMGQVGLLDSVAVATEVQTNQTKAKWKTYREYFTTEAPDARLDYIFTSNNLVVDAYTVYDTPYDVGDSSDHHPTYADYYIGH